ncbi:hypothetical protein FHS15_001246 [Paenibacillus castaneae]|uniref:hypothetical protein n=1 Tax=Paenibacillus castaneae TaxID=474957 RepID=UPI00141B48DA|nr:hypothetical protein [Paenibacillus castaneae]NIK76139.1 hypothetical protein [Paenibacillus castaneae]
MKDKDFRIAELSDTKDALDAIRKLEQQLSQQYGSEVALIAYAAETDEKKN